jgi:hypothetical protein
LGFDGFHGRFFASRFTGQDLFGDGIKIFQVSLEGLCARFF